MQVDARISRIHIKLKSNQPFCKLPAKQHCQSSLSGCSFLSSLALPSKRACLISTFLYSLHHASMKNSLSKFIYYIYLISGKVTFAYISFPPKNYVYSRVRNKHSPMLINFLTFFQGLRPYSGLHRAYFRSISIRYKVGYAYSFC